MLRLRVKWLHLASPRGESFQGFWVVDSNDQPQHDKPFATQRTAQVWKGDICTWGDVAEFVALHSLPFKVMRFNMSNAGRLVDTVGDELAASDLYTAREVVIFTAREEHKLPCY